MSEDADVTTIFSASSVNAYNTCHLQWWFTYVLAHEGEQSEAQAVGIAVHNAAEFMLREMMGWQPSIEWLAKHRLVATPAVASATSVFKQDILPTYHKPVLIEHPFLIEVNDIPYSGYIDSVDRASSHSYVLRDLKTTGSRPARGKHRFAMTGYWLGATQEGFEPDAAQLDWIIRIRVPYYWPEVMDPITDEDISIFATTLERTAEGVASGNFEPTGLGTYACSYCPARDICGPYKRYQNISPLRQEVTNA